MIETLLKQASFYCQENFLAPIINHGLVISINILLRPLIFTEFLWAADDVYTTVKNRLSWSFSGLRGILIFSENNFICGRYSTISFRRIITSCNQKDKTTLSHFQGASALSAFIVIVQVISACIHVINSKSYEPNQHSEIKCGVFNVNQYQKEQFWKCLRKFAIKMKTINE